MASDKNIIPHSHKISINERRELLAQRSVILWFTGLSGSGKSTIAGLVEEELNAKGFLTYILDGDNVRNGLNSDLGFSEEDRKENIRRIGELSKLFVDAGIIVLAAFISPYASERDGVRKLVAKGDFFEIYINCPLSTCEQRDPKQLYAKARKGEVKNFTGIDAPFEEPVNPEVEIRSDQMDARAAADKIIRYVLPKIQLD